MAERIQNGLNKSYQAQRPELDYEIELSDNARTVLEKRYLRKGPDGKPEETVEEMFWRVAWHVAAPEDDYDDSDRQTVAEEFYRLLTAKRFFPNSPTFTGAGTPLGQLAACFVLQIEDDMGKKDGGIFNTLRDAALIQQTGGGNGFAFSRLRPKGAIVKTSNGQATGPIGFLSVYDQAFGEIAQGGSRRGANMGVLRVDHPDIREFITCKIDENAITNFNISVGITDEFMQAVRDDRDFQLINPQDGEVWETISARGLFEKIVQQAHSNGEPGMLFLDAANRDNPVPHLYQLEATNPCFVGSTRIATEFGLLRLDDLAASGLAAFVASDERAPLDHKDVPSKRLGVSLRPASPAWMTRQSAPVRKLTTKMGYTITATPDHQFLTPDGYVALSDLTPGTRLLLQSDEGAWSRNYALPNVEYVQSKMSHMALSGNHQTGDVVQRRDFQELYAGVPERWSFDLGLVMGFLVGDGWLSPTSASAVGFAFGDQRMAERVRRAMTPWFGPGHLHDRGSVKQLTYNRVPFEFFQSLGVQAVRAHEKTVPDSIWTAPRESVAGFLQGLFTADGSVQVNLKKKDCSVRLASSSRQLLEDVQVLLSNFGIVSRIYTRREAGTRPMPDGKGGFADYDFHTQYELVLGAANRDRFAELIGFASPRKQKDLVAFIESKTRRSNRERFVDTVLTVEDAGAADVYDLTQFHTHSLIVNGLVASNCGEQYLGPNENCCLGSINLSRHVTLDNTVDWDALRDSVVTATRFLDDVVDANEYVPAVPELRLAAERVRRIGLGFMGLGDMMYRLGVRYGSAEGQEFAAQIMEFIQYHAMHTSIERARDRGSFLAIRGSRFDPDDLKWTAPEPLTPYTRDWSRPDLDWASVRSGILEHGIRNGAISTIAPTGTISTVAGCEGYGCEPVFALAYTRYFDDNGTRRELQYTSPLFEAALVAAGLDEDARAAIIEQVNLTGSCQTVEDLPDHIRHTFVVAADITAEDHVRMQASLQRFVSNAISKTCNFPSTATPADVAQAYQLAWELGCKGLTVYVAGSRDKVVLETAETAKAREGDSANGASPASNGKAASLPAAPAAAASGPVKRPRSRRLKGYTYRVETPLGTAFVTINENGGDLPFEVFINTAKAGSETAAVSEALGRLISYVLRMNASADPHTRLKEVIRQLEGIGGGRSLGLGPNRVRSLPDGIARVLREYLEDSLAGKLDHDEVQPHHPPVETEPAVEVAPAAMSLPVGISPDLCPDCGQAAVVKEEGCMKCYACGYSEC